VVDFTAAGAFASTLCQVTIRVSDTEPPTGDVTSFDPCRITKLHIDKRSRRGRFDFAGRFGLDELSDGIDPLTEDVTVSFDDFTLTIPAGSFVRRGRRIFRFRGVIDGVRIHADLKAPNEPRGHGRSGRGRSHRHELWSFKIKGKHADLSSVDNHVDAGLQVGDDGCFQTVRARIKH
jgi:hypothetical protein